MVTPSEALETITAEVQHHTADPHWLAENRVTLAGLYSYFSGQLEQILFTKPDDWNLLRVNEKSDKATDRKYEATENGKKEVIYRQRLKRIEKLSSAMRTMIDILSGESRQQM